MANKVITFVIDTLEPDLESILAVAVNEIHSLGHSIKEIRIMDDTGESKVPTNQINGVTVQEPVPHESKPVDPAPEQSDPIVRAPGVPATAPPAMVTDATTTKQVEQGTSDTTPKEPPITGTTGGTVTGDTLPGVGYSNPNPDPVPAEPDNQDPPLDIPPVQEPIPPTQTPVNAGDSPSPSPSDSATNG